MVIRINRAPILTQRATIVAQQLGHDRALALTLGRAVAGFAAYAKAKRLGLAEDSRESPAERRAREQAEVDAIDVMGRRIPVSKTKDGVRAIDTAGKPMSAASVEKYLAGKFGPGLDDARKAMVALAKTMSASELRTRAFGLYEVFRPEIPEGAKGWGAAGELDVERIRSATLAPPRRA